MIRINEATFEELQQLPSIGPRRAERIIRYREKVAPLTGHSDLAAVVGISEASARQAAQWIDWSSNTRPLPANLLFAACAVVAAAFLYHFAVTGYEVAEPGPAPSLYLICVLLVLVGSFTAVARQTVAGLASKIPATGWIAATTLSSGMILMVALLVTVWVAGIRDPFAAHIVDTAQLALFVTIIVLLIYGPGWHVRSALGRFSGAANLFDYGQLLLAGGTLAILALQHRSTLIELLFGVWAGVTLFINGREMARGKSSYVGNLSEREQARLAFFMQEDSGNTSGIGNPRLLMPAGWLLVLLSIMLIVQTIRSLLAIYS